MSSAIEAGRAFVRIMAQDDTKKTLDKIGARFKAWGAGLAVVGGGMLAASAGLMAALNSALGQFLSVGGAIDDMSGRTGIAREALQELGFAATQGGATMKEFEIALQSMARKTGKSSVEALLAYADAIDAIEDPGLKAQKAMEIFGKSGTKLLPMLAGGSAAIQKMREQARLMGLVLSEDDSKAADKLGDSIAQLQGTVKGIMLQIGAALAPLVQFAVDGLQPIVTTIVRLVKENRGLVQAFAIGAAVVGALGAVLLTVGSALVGVGIFLAALPMIVTGIATALSFMGAIFAAVFSPVGILVMSIVAAVAALAAGIAALGYWFLTSTQWGKSFMAALGELWKFATKTFRGIADALQAGRLDLAGKVALAALNVAWQFGIGLLQYAWADFTDWFVDTILAAVKTAAAAMEGLAIDATAAILSALGLTSMIPAAVTPMVGMVTGKVDAPASALSAGLDADSARRRKKADDDLAKALAEMAAVTKEAADAKAAVEAKAKLPKFRFDDVAETLKASAAGTFSGFAAGLLGQAGGSALEKEAKKHTELLKGIKDGIDDLEGAEVMP